YESNEITADSAEPKSIDELKKEHGIRRVSGAKKGPDSVQYGEEWLGDLDEIVIDPLRTPNLAREFENIDYQTDKDGNPKPRLEDNENHSIDATRYAFESDMKQSGVRVLT
ncbi:terminase large subunit, partial [Bacillus altitudinis]|uniref:terminase large subunit n=1 Tax=Bacillus altitudinis TaxID=293387 RepID=UPI00372CFE67